MRPALLIIAIFFTAPCLQGQPMNDECDQAFFIEDPGNWCSEPGDFFTLGANISMGLDASCADVNTPDVWFSFVPTTTSISIVVLSEFVSSNPLIGPTISIYEGNCSGPTEQACSAGFFLGTANQLFYDELTLGQLYYIRVQGATGSQGAFQICLNSFNQPAPPSPDCPQAAVLCDKSTFVVPKVFGGGVDPSEADDAPCLSGFSNVESSSTWYVWTAANDGTLTFDLTPLNPSDDIDFVVYRFPNGPGDCSDKEPIRCMASSCDGSTGLDESSVDFNEPPNCSLPTQDNYLAALNMESGMTYGVMINNFSNTEIGFEMSFGGTGMFAGPAINIVSEPSNRVCVNAPATFTEFIDYPAGQILSWEWNFGANASIPSASTPGPHELSFSEIGTQVISLSVTTAEGCITTETIELEVVCCEGNFDITTHIQATSCFESEDGSVEISIDNPAGPPYTVVWSNGENGAQVSGLDAGQYVVTITDGAACDTVLNIEVPASPAFEYDTILVRPSCDGGMDGSITLNASGGNPPILYSWEGAPFSNNNTLDNLGNGLYTVVIQDQNICFDTLEIPLQELQLELSPAVQAILPPSCPGDSDAQITVVIDNGLPPYLYDFNDGNGYVSQNILDQLPAGIYNVAVLDANLCEGNFTFEVNDPEPVSASILETPISCFEFSDGTLLAIPTGGTGDYQYNWSTGAATPSIDNLTAGNYQLSITDENDCLYTTQYTLTEPSLLTLAVEQAVNLSCFGDGNGLIELTAAGGTLPYSYSLNGQPGQSMPLFDNLPAGEYELSVADLNGCEAMTAVSLTEPDSLWVYILPVAPITLGYTAELRTQASLPGLTYTWVAIDSLSCLACPSPISRPVSSAWFYVTVNDAQGCEATDSVFVEIRPERPTYLPNAFSPNGDGRNDFFQLYSGPAVKRVISLTIYNRWGGMVYEQNNLPGQNAVLRWDGNVGNERASTGVYTYIAEVEFIDGIQQTLSGNLHLVY
jgi:gliding motility-associated-like protein